MAKPGAINGLHISCTRTLAACLSNIRIDRCDFDELEDACRRVLLLVGHISHRQHHLVTLNIVVSRELLKCVLGSLQLLDLRSVIVCIVSIVQVLVRLVDDNVVG